MAEISSENPPDFITTTPALSQRPVLRRSSSFDRFIPFRPELDLEGAHHKLLQTSQRRFSSPSSLETLPRQLFTPNNLQDPSRMSTEGSLLSSLRSLSLDDGDRPRPPLEYQRRLSLALDLRDLPGSGCSRILPLSSTTPSPRSPSVSVLNTSRSSDHWAGAEEGSPFSATPPRTPRKVRTKPDTVLLIHFRDDFYCNLLDWGRTNTIGVGVKGGADLWHADTKKATHIQPYPPGARGQAPPAGGRRRGHVSSVRWDQSGGRLALGYSHGTLAIWDAAAMELSQDMTMPEDTQLDSLCWWNNTLFCGTSSGRVYHYDLRENTPLPAPCAPVHRKHVCSVQLSPDESTLACGGADGVISVWEPRGKAVLTKLCTHKTGTRALAWCPWRRNVLASGGGTSDGSIRIWSVSAGAVKAEVDTGMRVCHVLWSEEYRELVTGHGARRREGEGGGAGERRHELLLWSVGPRDWNLAFLARLHAPRGRPLNQCLSPDHTTLASASADDHLSLWTLFPKKRRSGFSTSPLNLDRFIR